MPTAWPSEPSHPDYDEWRDRQRRTPPEGLSAVEVRGGAFELDGVDYLIPGVSSVDPWRTGLWVSPPIGTSGTVVLPAAELRLLRLVAPRDANVDRLAASVTTVGTAGSLVRLGIYLDADGDGVPDTLLVDGGTIDGTSATVQEVTIAAAVSAGPLWVGAVGQGAPTTEATLRSSTFPGNQLIGDTATQALTTISPAFRATGVTGALPATIAPVLSTAVQTGRVAVRVA